MPAPTPPVPSAPLSPPWCLSPKVVFFFNPHIPPCIPRTIVLLLKLHTVNWFQSGVPMTGSTLTALAASPETSTLSSAVSTAAASATAASTTAASATAASTTAASATAASAARNAWTSNFSSIVRPLSSVVYRLSSIVLRLSSIVLRLSSFVYRPIIRSSSFRYYFLLKNI